MSKLTLIVHDIYRDGGTKVCYEKENPTVRYYVSSGMADHPYQIYDKYPGDVDAKPLEIEFRIYNPYRTRVSYRCMSR